MWNDRINYTALTTPAAGWFFNTEHPLGIELSDERSTSDESLLATLRFLLYKKVSGEQVRVLGVQTGSPVEESNIPYRIRRLYARCRDNSVDSCLEFIETGSAPDVLKQGLENFLGLDKSDGNLLPAGTVFDCGTVTSRTGEEIPIKLEYQPSITYFFGVKFGVYAFTDAEKRISMVITSRLNNQKFHWLQAVIPMLMPWYWAGSDGSISLDRESLNLLEKLNSVDKDGYLSLLKEFADQLGFEETYVDSRLKDFLVSAQRNQIDRAQSEVSDIRRRIQEYMDEIGRYTRSVNEKLVYIAGLELAVENTQTGEFAEYIRNNDSVDVREFGTGTMEILCHGLFEYYDSDQLQELIDNRRSYIYSASAGTKLEGKIAKLLKAIFIDESLRLKVCAPYRISVRDVEVHALSGVSDPTGFEDYFPNPHIYHHGCIGDYAKTMMQYITDGNWMGVVDQCVASNATMNFFDSTVTRELVSDLASNYNTRKCIVLPDGSEVTIEGALKYLDEEE